MADITELSTMLLKRFKDVPNVTKEDATAWVERSLLEHGYTTDQDVPQEEILLVLMYAEWDGALQIALKAAHFFEYKDGDETVDKRNVSEQYRQIATELKRNYDRKKGQGSGQLGGSRFHVATRPDR